MSGAKYDNKKPMMALIPPTALEEEAWVWTFGAQKYDKWNWNKGLEFTRILSALMRHTNALVKGQDIDPESGRHHGAHIRCCAAMLIEYYNAGRYELDDRMESEFRDLLESKDD